MYKKVNDFHSRAQDRDEHSKEAFYERAMTLIENLQDLNRDPKSSAYNPKKRKFDEDIRDVTVESEAKT
jgi:hypothetical protein